MHSFKITCFSIMERWVRTGVNDAKVANSIMFSSILHEISTVSRETKPIPHYQARSNLIPLTGHVPGKQLITLVLPLNPCSRKLIAANCQAHRRCRA